jgi:pteridine reductase
MASVATARVALVTGGAIRVGRAIALRLAREGMDVAITYRTSAAEAADLVESIRRLGRRAIAIAADLAQADAVDLIHREFTARFDRLDALVNNASIFAPCPIGSISHEEVQRQLAVNAIAPLMLIQRFTPLLGAHYDAADPASPGRIVNFIDIHVMGEPLKGYLPYNMSKAALAEITQTAAMELAPRITVNAIAPGVVAWAPEYTEQMKAQYMTRVPLARPGTPEDAAAAAKFLILDAHYCTGQVIKLDGGRALT